MDEFWLDQRLLDAAKRGDESTIRSLLDEGVDINRPSRYESSSCCLSDGL